MRLIQLEKILLSIILIIFGLIVLHAPLSVGFGVLFPDYSLIIKSWKEILIFISLIILSITISRRELWRSVFNDWLVRLIAVYAGLHFLLILFKFNNLTVSLAGLAIDLRYLAFFILVYVFMKITGGIYKNMILIVNTLGAVIVTGFAVLQLFLPTDFLKYIGYSRQSISPYLTVDKNYDYIRIISTLRGPNPLGAYAVIILSIALAFIVNMKNKLIDKKYTYLAYCLIATSSIALWFSYSRSALIAGLGAVFVILVVKYANQINKKLYFAIGIVILVSLGGLFLARDTAIVSNIILHENPADNNDINSNDGHLESLIEGLRRVASEPLGAGIGSTGSASLFGDKPLIIENQYLFIAHESGWIGLVLFLSIFIIIMNRLWHDRQDFLSLGLFASGAGLAFIGLLLPVWVDDTVSIVWWGLSAVAIVGKAKYGISKTNKKTT
mgnify:CR=1 FL=1